MKNKFKNINIKKITLWSLMVAFILFVFIFYFWHWHLPDVIENEAIYSLKKQFNLKEMDFNIRRIGSSGADVENVLMEDKNGGQLLINSLRLDMELENGNIENITIAGAKINLYIENGQLRVDGLDISSLLENSKNSTKKSSNSLINLKNITLNNVELNFNGKSIVVYGKIALKGNNYSEIIADLKLVNSNFIVAGKIIYNQEKGVVDWNINGNANLVRIINSLYLYPIDKINFISNGELRLQKNEALISGNANIELLPSKSSPINVWQFSKPIKAKQSFDARYTLNDNKGYIMTSGRAENINLKALNGALKTTNCGDMVWELALSISDNKLNLSELKFNWYDIVLNAFSSEVVLPNIELLRLNEEVVLSAKGISAKMDSAKLKLDDIEIFSPINPQKRNSGYFKINKSYYEKLEVGNFESSFYLDNEKNLILNGKINSNMFKNKTFSLNGIVPKVIDGSGNYALELTLPPNKFSIDEFKRFAPELQGIYGDFIATMGLSFSSENGKINSGGQLFITDGKISIPEEKINASGMSIRLSSSDIFSLSSSTNQFIKVKNLNSETLSAQNLDLHFQIVSPEEIMLQNLSANFCGGEVYIRPISLRLDQKRVKVNLHLERVELIRLLDELDLAEGIGDSVVSGKIPIVINKHGVQFLPGFLYSSPGEKSNIMLSNAEALGAGAYLGGQLDFAMEALKDFICDWVKVNISSKDKILQISLKFNGKPNGPLPFTYDNKSGTLIRKAGMKATFQGIELNINTKLKVRDFRRIQNYFLKQEK